jgi:hypothetical protein
MLNLPHNSGSQEDKCNLSAWEQQLQDKLEAGQMNGWFHYALGAVGGRGRCDDRKRRAGTDALPWNSRGSPNLAVISSPFSMTQKL